MIGQLGMAQLVDVVIAFTLVEGGVLAAYHRLTGKGVALHDFIANMVSGVCLMLALRCVLRDGPAPWVALLLLFAGMAHATDIWLRWRRSAALAARFALTARHTSVLDSTLSSHCP